MVKKHRVKREPECSVCYSTHDDEIHEATLRIHQWFCHQVTHQFVDDGFLELQGQTLTN